MVETGNDIKRNLLTIRFAGRVGSDDLKSIFEETLRLLNQLQSGFTLLTDLTGLESMDVACAPYIQRVMDRCNEKDVSTVVRVIPDPHKDIGFNILSLFHYDRGVRIVTCQTREEALQALS
jgi:hypothetical protein